MPEEYIAWHERYFVDFADRIRGTDAGIGWALLLTGYREAALADLVSDLGGALQQRGGTAVLDSMYRMDYSLARHEINA